MSVCSRRVSRAHEGLFLGRVLGATGGFPLCYYRNPSSTKFSTALPRPGGQDAGSTTVPGWAWRTRIGLRPGVAIGSRAIAVARTMGARCFRKK